jgi:membrane protease YdiL (CAAX protease family)
MDGTELRRLLGVPLASVPWVPLAVGSGLLLAIPHLGVPVSSLAGQVLRDGLIILVLPMVLATAAGRRLGWRVDRSVVLYGGALTTFVLPFYVVGSTLPSVRAAYPYWQVDPSIGGFLPYALGLVMVVVAAETFYRGLLCVSVRDIGPACVLISPAIYLVWHFGDPPIELLLAVPADVLFGAVDYRSRSILPSVLAHATGYVLLSWLVLHPPVLPPEMVVQFLEWVPGIPG